MDREKWEFLDWLVQSYGKNSKIVQTFMVDMNKNMPWPPKRDLIKGIGWGWNYDWNKYYNAFKNPQTVEAPQIEGVTGTNITDIGTQDEADAEKKYSGYTPEEWGLGVPELDWQKQQFDWQKQQTGLDRSTRAAELQTERQIAQWNAQAQASNAAATQLQQGWLNTSQGGMTAQGLREQEYLAKQFEDALSLLEPSPRNWIQSSIAEAYKSGEIQNPFRPQRDDPLVQWNIAKEELEIAESLEKHVKGWEKAAESPDVALSPQQIDLIKVAKDRAALARQTISEIETARLAGMEAARTGQPLDYTGAYAWQAQAGWAATAGLMGNPDATRWVKENLPQKPQETTISTPDWLAKATGITGIPSRNQTRQSIARPSGQSWAQWSPSQREQYMGLTDWLSDVPTEDVLASAQNQLTQPLSLGKRWSAF